jgi:hypothetical protein
MVRLASISRNGGLRDGHSTICADGDTIDEPVASRSSSRDNANCSWVDHSEGEGVTERDRRVGWRNGDGRRSLDGWNKSRQYTCLSLDFRWFIGESAEGNHDKREKTARRRTPRPYGNREVEEGLKTHHQGLTVCREQQRYHHRSQ